MGETGSGLFELLDFDGDGRLQIDEFAYGLLQLHGNARSIDMVRLKHDALKLAEQLEDISKMSIQYFEKLDRRVQVAQQSHAVASLTAALIPPVLTPATSLPS